MRDAHPCFAEILKHHQVKKRCGALASPASATSYAPASTSASTSHTGWICDERRGRHLLDLVREIPATGCFSRPTRRTSRRDLRPQPEVGATSLLFGRTSRRLLPARSAAPCGSGCRDLAQCAHAFRDR